MATMTEVVALLICSKHKTD